MTPPSSAPKTSLDRLLQDGSDADVQRFLAVLSPPETADLLEALPDGDSRARAFRLILGRDQARVLRDMNEGERGELVESLRAVETAEVIEQMVSDDAVDVLQEMSEDRQQRVLDALPQEDRAALERVLEYPADSAGGIMQTELVRVPAEASVREAIDVIRRSAEDVGELHEVFVVDRSGRLVGWVKERALILARDETPISTISRSVPARVQVSEDQEEIAALVGDYDLSSIPVVDEEDRLVGRILIDDILDVVQEEADEDILRQAGSKPEELDSRTIAMALKSRLPWLIVTFVGGIAAALIISAGEHSVRQAGALFAFIPVIMGMGGASATQTATVTVRSLVTKRISVGDLRAVVLKEVWVGLILATLTGALLLLVVRLTEGDTIVALIAAGALFGTVCLGTLFGVLSPLVLDRVGADPAVASGPFVTTLNDLLGSSIIWALCLWLVG